MATRTRRELEPKWVSWYVAKAFPDGIVKLRCPLGPIPKKVTNAFGQAKGLKIYRPWRPEVDACVITPKRTVIIEAKIQKFMDGLSKLPVYKHLVATTPELKAWKRSPVIMQLLTPAHIPWVEAAAADMKVNVIVDAPEFILEVWRERDKYWTKPYMEKREKRKKKLTELGYT